MKGSERAQRATISLSPYGRLPISDSRVQVTIELLLRHVREGKRNRPAECAIALGSVDDHNRHHFQGKLLAIWVWKTVAIAVTRIDGVLQAKRFAHDQLTRAKINGWDRRETKYTLHAGDRITLLPPRGHSKLGAPRSGSPKGAQTHGSNRPPCHRRGSFVSVVDARQAAQDAAAQRELFGQAVTVA